MSRDTAPTYVHMRSSRFADLFEEFCRPPSSTVSSSLANANANINPGNIQYHHHSRDPVNLHSAVAAAAAAAASNNSNGNWGGGGGSSGNYANVVVPASSDGMIQIPGSFLPYEEISLPPHLMPVNPEDEDDVVPDMHAAFGIQQALGSGAQNAGVAEASGRQTAIRGEERWRDLGLEGLLHDTTTALGGGDLGAASHPAAPMGSGGLMNNGGVGGTTMARREGRRAGILLMR